MDYRAEVLRNCPKFDTDSFAKKLDLAGLGIAGEAGEVADIVKKVLHHEVPIAEVHDKLMKEAGDVEWYLEYLYATMGWTRERVQMANVEKLRLRHPHGWTPASQQAKADEKTEAAR